MLHAFTYYTLILLIIIFYLFLFFINLKKSPKKIKIAMGACIGFAIMKNLFLLFMAISEIAINVKIAKIFSFLDLAYIPAIIVVLFYVFWRSNKINFNKIITVLIGFVTLYITAMLIFKSTFKVSWEFGYTIEMMNNFIFRILYIAIFLILLIFIVLIKMGVQTNILGVNFIVIALCGYILENLIYLAVPYFPYCLISELILTGVIFYGFRTFKS